MTLDNFMNRIWIRFIEALNKLTLYFIWKDGLGGFWDGDGRLDFATITQRH